MKIDFTKLKIGDRLIREKGGIFSKHHVLYAGRDSITGKHIIAENQRNYGVRIISLEQFLKEGKLVQIDYNNFSYPQQTKTTLRIKTRLGKSYDLLKYNCEQFVNDVLHGIIESKQVQNALFASFGVLVLFMVLLLSKQH
ncbi:YiiX/YebB-like N1pC/P60 family cysteine hydrolase [Aureispira anguillae]|uniref:Lecithin retinol acyltransferase family protein n=1 Tax=Aureispira anguillae TaxID=2864201 RepID=A0A916DT45_9BACT|nr:YiiX/YebB-like N1pC/P60 family cysteine hydrolase [Aureispira anguillae]BDS11502.1 lecithin retinol acyltransferase family protein [Aureispira anguillae]